jgi:hypothetical protein
MATAARERLRRLLQLGFWFFLISRQPLTPGALVARVEAQLPTLCVIGD